MSQSETPDEAVQHAAEVMLRQYESQYDAAHLTWRDFADDARAILDAAAVPGLLAAAERVRALHKTFTEPGQPSYCTEDSALWPCPTIRALEGEQ